MPLYLRAFPTVCKSKDRGCVQPLRLIEEQPPRTDCIAGHCGHAFPFSSVPSPVILTLVWS